MDTSKPIMISCGGTGGHFYPGLAVARKYAELGGQPILVLGGIHSEKQMSAAAGFHIQAFPISSAPLSKNPIKLMIFVFKVLAGILQCRKAFKKAQPKALLAMGSFASLPPVLAAWSMKIPVFLHDGNSRIGRANRVLSRFAKAVALSFPAVNSNTCKCPCVHTGMPLRPELLSGVRTKQAAIDEINKRWNCGFTADAPTILIFGGSLGASMINTHLHAKTDMPGLDKLQIIRLSGPGKLEELKERTKDSPAKHLLLESFPEMDLMYSAADVVVCRSGGSTVSELAVFGKYALLIPFPYAAEGHQDDNARWLASAGGAEIMADKDCSEERFTAFLERWLAEPEKYAALGEQSKTLGEPKAAGNVLDLIENITSLNK